MQKQLKRFIGLIFLLQFFTVSTFAQSWEKVKRIGGNGFESSTAIARDNNGNTYVVGQFNGDITIGSITLTSTPSNCFIAKLDSNGNAVWAKDFVVSGFNAFNLQYGIEVDNNGNIYFTGGFSSNGITDFGNGVILSPNTNGSFNQTFIVKYDTNGLAQWAKAMSSGSSLFSFERRLQVTGAGEIFILGSYNTTLLFNNSVTLSTSSTTEKGFLLKLSTAGAVIWSKGVLPNVANYIFSKDVAILPDETSVNVAGFTASGNCFTCPGASFQDTRVFIAKYNAQTGALENSILTDPAANDVSNLNIATSDSGDIFMTLSFNSEIKINNQSYTSLNGTDAVFIRMNKNFTWDFVQVLSSISSTTISDIIYKDGNVILGTGSVEYLIIDSTSLIQSPLYSSIVLLQFTETGILEYYKTIKNISSTSFSVFKNVTGLVAGDGDKYYAYGSFYYNGIFDSDTLFAQSSSDLFWAEVSCTPRSISEIQGDTIVCLGQQDYSLPETTFGPGIDYQWTVTDSTGVNIPFTQLDTSINVTWTATGRYQITVTAFNGCGSSPLTTTYVNVIDIPSAEVINGDPTACLGQSTYNVPNNDFNTYNWSISGGGSVFPIGNTVIINWAVTGNFDVFVAASNECGTGSISSFPITVKAIPAEPSPIVGNNNICISTQTYSVASTVNVDYNWSLSSGGTITSNGNIATVNWASSGNHTIIVTPTNECGTGSSRTLGINVNDVPTQPSTVVGNLLTCVGTESYSVVGNTNSNYTWAISSGGVLTSGGSSAAIIWTTPGTHTMTITPSNICGTGTPRTVNVIVRDVPTQAGNFIGLDTVCIGQQNYQIPVQQGVNYTWSISGGGIVIPNGNAATIDWTNGGTHTITVTPYNTCGTGQSRSFVVFVKNINSAFNTINGEDTVCLGIENYTVPNVGGISYNWSVNGGGTLTQINNSAFVTWAGTGIYTLNVATSDGCNSALNVEVRDAPAQPTPISGDAVVCIGTYNYGIVSEPNVNYSWTLSGGGILIENSNFATINWQNSGIYTLTVTPFNDCGTGTPQAITIDVRTIPNAPNAVTGDTLVCLSNQIYTVPANPLVTYNWSLSNGGAVLVPASNQANINWQTIDTNTITVTASNLCGTSPQTVLAVEVIDIPNIPTITGDTSTCLVLENYSISTQNYTTNTWNLSSGGSLNVTGNIGNINWQNVGTHTITVGATNICGSAIPNTLSVNVIDVPVQPTSIIGDAVACQSLKSYSVPTAANTDYTWTLSSGGAISALGNVANINWITPGTHTITVTPFNDCGTGISILKTVIVTGIPTQPSSITGTAITCLSTNNYSVINDPAITYTWTLNGGGTVTPNGNTATVNWQTAGIYTLSVVPQTICGVGIPRSMTVQVSDVPNIPQLVTGDTSVCVGNRLYSISQVSGVSYNWSLSSGGTLTAAGNNATINWTGTGTHTLVITPSNSCGNGNALLKTIDVANVPNQAATIGGNTNICLGNQTYTIPNIAGESYIWTLSSGGLLSANGNTATVNWLSSGSHTLSVVPSNSCGVAPLTSLVVNVESVPNQPNNIIGKNEICENTTEIYTISTVNNVNYTWSISGGGTVSSVGNTATIDWQMPGVYIISVIPSNNCGTGVTRTKTIEVRGNDLTTSTITGDELVCNGSELFYTADFDNNLDYDWFISGNGNLTQVSNSAVVQWEEAGTAIIGLIPSSECGVGDTAFINVTIENPLPTPAITLSGDSLIANVTEGLTWYVDGDVITITESFIIPQLEGVYTISGENVCGQTGFSLPVEIGGNEEGMYFYPNPASKRVTLHFPIYLRWYYFDIIDYSGKRVLETLEYNGTNEIEVNIRTLQSGMYVVRIYTELGWFYKKLIVAN